MCSRFVLGTSLVAIGFASSASAEDFLSFGQPGTPPAYNWTGLYVGGTVGRSWATSNSTTSTGPAFPYFEVASNVAAVNGAGSQIINTSGPSAQRRASTGRPVMSFSA